MRVWRMLCRFLLSTLLLASPLAAHAAGIDLRASICSASAPAGDVPSAATIGALRYTCPARPHGPAPRNDWTWLRVTRVAALHDLPARWQLLVDQSRFDRVAVVTVLRRGPGQRLIRDSGDLARNWAPGGLLRFTVDAPGAEVKDLYIGFSRLDDLGLMRKITAAAPEDATHATAGWLLLIGLFVGALLSAFAYNLLIYTGQRYAFQRWYLTWAAVTLAYGLTWTNAAAFLVPGFVGPWAVRAEFVLVGLMIGAGNMFLLSVLEEGMLPRWLRRAATTLAIVSVWLGILAAADRLLPAALTDRWLNYAVLGSAISVGACVTFAIRRGSRTVWFYLAGWTPVICVFALRLSRNFGLMQQNDAVDMATFATIALESVVLSLAIADRFRLLRQERDSAEQARNAIEIEKETLQRAARTDFLTGLGNRAAFQIELQALADRPAPARFKLLLIDVDHLKAVNDRLGHDGGDALLRHVGSRLAAVAGAGASVARLGGDEFAILMSSESRAQELAVGQALDEVQEEEWSHGGRQWPLSLSIGSARFPEDAVDADTLYKNADLTLYQAKRLGRQQRRRYDPSLRAMTERKASFVREAHAGLERGEFALHYQPIVELENGRVVGHESLLRWHHPTHGVLTPAIFGEILTEQTIGTRIQKHVLALALAEIERARQPDTFLSVNFTAAQLGGVPAAQRLLEQLRAMGVPPAALCIELTEGIVLDRAADEIACALRILSDAGIRIALDDFGTGYASLIHLKELPIDTLKIDRSFVLGLLDDGGQSEEIVRAIIGLGTGLGKAVVAEGVETEAQRRRLRHLGCTFGQGYLFARPAPARVDHMLPLPSSSEIAAQVA